MLRSSSVVFLLLSFFAFEALADERRNVMLTGYWPPTNEMLRPFSQNKKQNPGGWTGKNWEGLGFDVLAFFSEFKNLRSDSRGTGDFEVDYGDTKYDFDRITAELKPIAIISFGRGAGPWEVETTFKKYIQYRVDGPDELKAKLPLKEIVNRVSSLTPLRAWIDHHSNAGDYLCGFLGYLGAMYRVENENHPTHPMVYSGFIHVDHARPLEDYRKAARVSIRVILENLRKTQ